MKLKRKTEEDHICREDEKIIAKKGIMTVIRMEINIHTHTQVDYYTLVAT